MTEIQPILDAENITLAWPRPDGRIDEYFIRWFPLDAPEQDLAKTIPGNIGTEGINRLVKVDFLYFQPVEVLAYSMFTSRCSSQA